MGMFYPKKKRTFAEIVWHWVKDEGSVYQTAYFDYSGRLYGFVRKTDYTERGIARLVSDVVCGSDAFSYSLGKREVEADFFP